MGALQPYHLIVILVIVLIIFGPGKIADLGKSVGEGLRELRKASDPGAGHSGADHSGSATSSVAAARTCPSCHGAVATSDKFCGHCGTSVPA